MPKITVKWFDAMNGIGCGVDAIGRRISLNARDIIPDGRFLTLKPLETVTCDVVKSGEDYFAENIKRRKGKPRKPERDTFLPEKRIEI